jgi:hypothetical protein
MSTRGLINLGDFAVTAAGTVIGDVVADLDGALSVLLSARLQYGSGGTTAKAYIQTSPDGGTTWVDIACIAFATTAKHALYNLSALTPKTTAATPTDGTLTDDTAVDGLLADRLRVKVTSVGTYAGSTVLSVRAVVR